MEQKIWNGLAILWDCLKEMKNIPDASIDCIITDPPYWKTACKWDIVIPFDPMWEQIKRIIKPNGAIVLFWSEPFSSALRMSNIKQYKYDWVWEKSQSRWHLLAYKRPMVKHELISIFNSKSYNPILSDKPLKDIRWFSKSWATEIYNNKTVCQSKTRKIPLDKKLPESILKFNNEQRYEHPTQKPVALIEYLIKTYSFEWDTILDFTTWVWTTWIACENTKRKWICIKKDEEYYNLMCKRLSTGIFV